MDRSPPPFFNQGTPAHLRLLFFALLAISLLIIDSRLALLNTLRQGLGTVLYPVQRTLLVPRDALRLAQDYLGEVHRLREENEAMRRVEVANASALLLAEQLATDNQRLRELLGAREKLPLRSQVAEVQYETRDPFSRRIVIDKGTGDGLLEGMPVVDAKGLIGQITRAFVASSEITLITDRSMAVPVESQRTGARSVVFGASDGELELRYLSNSVDLKPGDRWVTSGLDRIYPPGLPVGRVSEAPAGRESGFARNRLQPLGEVGRSRMLLVLMVDASALPPPAAPAGSDKSKKAPAR